MNWLRNLNQLAIIEDEAWGDDFDPENNKYINPNDIMKMDQGNYYHNVPDWKNFKGWG